MKEPVYDGNKNILPPSQWKEWKIEEKDNEAPGKLYLDNAYDEMITETYIAIQKPDEEVVIFKIDKVAIHPRTAYGQSGKTTEITLADNKTWWNPQADTFDVIRGTMVYAQSEQLELADDVNEKEVKKDTITLDECYLYLKTGQIIILSGERKDLKGVIASEVMKISEVKIEGGFTTLKF